MDAPAVEKKEFRHAWGVWLLLTVLCGAAMLIVTPLAQPWEGATSAWFLVPLLWLAFAVPAVVITHAETFKAEWGAAGSSDEQAGNAYGMAAVWGVLTVGVALSLAACLVAGNAEPGIWPGAVMMMLLVLTRPTAAMDSEAAGE